MEDDALETKKKKGLCCKGLMVSHFWNRLQFYISEQNLSSSSCIAIQIDSLVM